ncbi:hypothetical protein HYH02_014837 [Chlamydomonas schloesseri]|uniref:Uncharacterized protein n=1 Tax=Chlamydomonas schloesseri TaxID=2026947 RepID=A0A835SJK7_9CHLO|nr:hypothetical protein HYH02_014837 [Chlamydomonas schloesseri]|eukprot:KAG2426122.1 hypothetical protein HYH02_014837 [Chlamydomonas schloesseri]
MPRGNPNVWKEQLGSSYAQLAGTSTSCEQHRALAPRKLPPVSHADVEAVKALPAAGIPAKSLPRGAGGFVMQNTWSMGMPGANNTNTNTNNTTAARTTLTGSRINSGHEAVQGPSSLSATMPLSASGAGGGGGGSSSSSSGAGGGSSTARHSTATEQRANYVPPPAGYRRGASASKPASEMPKPNYQNDWSTSKQQDFKPDALSKLDPARPIRHRDSGRLLPQDIPPGDSAAVAAAFTTAARAAFTGPSRREAAAIPPGGGTCTRPAGYNIITGATPYANNTFEHWDGRDYRRHR